MQLEKVREAAAHSRVLVKEAEHLESLIVEPAEGWVRMQNGIYDGIAKYLRDRANEVIVNSVD